MLKTPGVRPYIFTVASDSAAAAGMLVALAWVVAHTAGASWTTALIFGLEAVPRAVLVIAGGALADRWGLLRAASVTLTIRVLLMALFTAVLFMPDNSRLWALAGIAFLFGLADAIHMPAIEGLRGLLVRDPDEQTKLTGTIGSVTQLVEVGAAPVAGFLVAFNDQTVGVILSALILAAWLGLRTVKSKARAEQVAIAASPGDSLMEEIRDGIRVVTRDRSILLMLVVLAVYNAVGTAPLIAGIPIKAKEHGWPGVVFGVATIGFALGGAAGAAAAAKFSSGIRKPRHTAYTLIVVAACLFGGLAASSSPYVVTACAAGAGGACSFAAQVFIAHLTSTTPETHLGRVMSLLQVSFYGGVPLGYVLFGALVALSGVAVAGIVMSVLLAGAAIAGIALHSETSISTV